MRLKSDSSVEFRFDLIVKLRQEGKSQTAIGRLVSCSQAWVSKVLKRYQEAGAAALKIKGKAPGKPPLLCPEQLQKLKAMLLEGALHWGFPTDNWTRERMAVLIEQQFSVSYHPAHISRLMHRIGFTRQKPKRKSFKQAPAAVETWYGETLPALKKKGT